MFSPWPDLPVYEDWILSRKEDFGGPGQDFQLFLLDLLDQLLLSTVSSLHQPPAQSIHFQGLLDAAKSGCSQQPAYLEERYFRFLKSKCQIWKVNCLRKYTICIQSMGPCFPPRRCFSRNYICLELGDPLEVFCSNPFILQMRKQL